MVPALSAAPGRGGAPDPASILSGVLDAIARAVLGDAHDAAVTLGAITLHAHQRDAVRRIRASIEDFGGALLADAPGAGKTFVALALAREFPPATVAAPAALRAMWRRAAASAGVDLKFVSMETLSRRATRIAPRRGASQPAPRAESGALVIVDEAHHASNPATARYARLAQLTSNRRVLLISGTPVRNRRNELAALLALFMGPRAYALDDAARSRCIVRRGGDASLRPAIDGPHWHRVRPAPRLAEMIDNLPPALPALDGREARGLLSMTLARCWASSLAALDVALRRRLQRGGILGLLLDEGRVPTRGELRAWVLGDDAVQLAFPVFAAHVTRDVAVLRATLQAHLDAVRALRALVRPRVERDAAERARLLLTLRHAHAGERIVAFTAYAATAEAVYRTLNRECGVALLTGRGARTAGGTRRRSELIDALGRDPGTVEARDDGTLGHAPGRDEISLLIATDLLSEGVNLQRASVVVHLDIPWTPAGLAQRVARAARMGSRHRCVHVHGIATPVAADRLLALARRLTRKHAEELESARAPAEAEELRAIVRPWRRDAGGPAHGDAHDSTCGGACAGGRDLPAARAWATRSGFLAVIETRGTASLICGARRGRGRWTVSDAPGDLLETARAVLPVPAPAHDGSEPGARAALSRWLAGRRARESSGAGGLSSAARRALLARIDSAVQRAAAHSRAALAYRAARIRTLVDLAVGAGEERTLHELARGATADAEAWLAECEARLDGALPRSAMRGGGAPVVRALLLLLRRA